MNQGGEGGALLFFEVKFAISGCLLRRNRALKRHAYDQKSQKDT